MRAIFNLGLLSIVAYLMLDVALVSEAKESRPVVQAVAGAGLLVMLVYCIYYAFKSNRVTKHWPFTAVWVIFVSYMAVYYVLSFLDLPSSNAHSNLRDLVIAVYCLVALVFIYYGVVNGSLSPLKLNLLVLAVLCNGLYEIYLAVSNPLIRYGGAEVINTSAGYVFLMLAPLLMYHYRKDNIWILLVTFALTLMTGKRGAILTYLILFLYIGLNHRVFLNRLKLNWKTGLYFLAITFAVVVFFDYAYESLELRIENIKHQEKGSLASGRDEIWIALLGYWANSGFIEVLFGSGFYSTYSIVDNVAHNDFLQFLVDFGLIGLLLYILVLVFLYRDLKKIKSVEPYLYSLLMCCIIILVFRGMIAGTIRTDNINLSISIGYLIGMATLKGCANARRY